MDQIFFFLEKFSQINGKYASGKFYEYIRIRSQDNREGVIFSIQENLGPKKPR